MTQETALHLMKSGYSVFLTGAPGTGKTYVINQYLDYLKQFGIQAAVTAPTGIAASHIGGQTIHSFFGLGIKNTITQYDLEELTEKKYLWNNMKDLKILIIDEVSMLSPEIFESIDKILRTFKFSNDAFGGVQVILVGDFFQLPPINRNATEKRFIFQTKLWQEMNLKICYLKKNYRQNDEILSNILQEIRNGEISEQSMEHFRSRYQKMPENISQITKLYTHNTDVDIINKQELEKIHEPIKTYEAYTTGSQKWVERIFSSSLVIPKLSLKKGALVFFIKNNYEKSYINGTLGEIVDFDVFDNPIVETHNGKRIKADRVEWVAQDQNGKQKASIKQIPLRLAWAITIHKSQGMTLDNAEIDLSKAFEPGQGYVALSRIKNITGLKLMGLGKIALATDEQVKKSDAQMEEQSQKNHHEIKKLSQKERKDQEQAYIKILGGSIEKAKEKTTRISSAHLASKPFFEQHLGIAEIAKKRNLSTDTIFKHLKKIIAENPEFDISYLQPKISLIEKVEQAQEKIKTKNNKADFSENGEIKLKSIFKELGEKTSYDDIKLALIFI